MSNLPPRTSPFFIMALCRELTEKMEVGQVVIELESTTVTSNFESFIKFNEPVTTPVPRHKSTHPADVQDRRRRRKQKL